jgi:CRISPR/Cas system-associated exonuclease Cas4 (RecB family)
MHVSPSTVKMLNLCPRRYYRDKVLKEEGYRATGEAAIWGSQFGEEVVKLLGAQLCDGKRTTAQLSDVPDDVKQAAERLVDVLPPKWQGCMAELPISITPERFIELCDQYNVSPPDHPCEVKGFIDLASYPHPAGLPDGLIELKTSGKSTFDPAWKLQCITYALATGAYEVDLYLYVRLKKPRIIRWSIPLNDAIKAETLITLGDAMDYIYRLHTGGKAPMATPSFACNYCQYSDDCVVANTFEREVKTYDFNS